MGAASASLAIGSSHLVHTKKLAEPTRGEEAALAILRPAIMADALQLDGDIVVGCGRSLACVRGEDCSDFRVRLPSRFREPNQITRLVRVGK